LYKKGLDLFLFLINQKILKNLLLGSVLVQFIER
jgi:hypothetical protein